MFFVHVSGQSIIRQTLQIAGSTQTYPGRVIIQSSIGQSSPTTNHQGFIQSRRKIPKDNMLGLRLFPNPGFGKFQIDFQFETNDAIKIYQNDGQEVYNSSTAKTSLMVIDITNLSAGKYTIVIMRNRDVIALDNLILIK